MFGLTRREQRWKAEQKAAEALIPLIAATVQAAAEIQVAEANTDAAELERLRAEVARLKAEVAELDSLRDRLADLLTRTAVALRGPEPPLTRYSWHDIPDRAAAAVAAIDVMQRAAFMAADPELVNARVQPLP